MKCPECPYSDCKSGIEAHLFIYHGYSKVRAAEMVARLEREEFK